MNNQQRALVLLMKSAITGEHYPLPEDFSLEPCLKLVLRHHMTTLIYEGAVNCGISPKDPAMQQLFQHYLRQLLRSEGQMRAIDQLRQVFREAGIDHMLLKGSRMKALYPKPELRYMADADILIRLEQYEKIRPIMEGLGYEEKEESDHELPWLGRELYLELHKRMIPSYDKDLFDYYGDGWKLAIPGEGCEYFMKPEDEWIFLFTHFAKHFREAGVGCRYVVDLWVWRNAHPDMDEAYIRGVMETMQIEKFYDNILRLLDNWFREGPEDPVLEAITEFVFSCGSWGAVSTRVLSVAVRDVKSPHRGIAGRLRYLRKVCFPTGEGIKQRYPVLRRHRWLLPLVWVVRGFRKVFCERELLEQKVEHLQLLSQDNIRQRQEMLQLVGLDYNF